MLHTHYLLFSLLSGLSAAIPQLPGLGSLSPLRPRDACSGNTATTRSEWCDYSIDTDYYNEVPDTGVTREYWFELTDVTVAPDGVSRTAQAINGSIPGPTIIADWGDTVVVHVTNSLSTSTNGTSIHFHGIRQNYTNPNDGVVSITQCPTAVGDSITYTWRATQYGSTWYHSHFALQAWEGVFGGIIINGPATSDYDEDLGMVFLNDWSHQTVDELYIQAEQSGPPTLDTGLINGTNVYGDDDDDDQVGSRLELNFTEGTSYRMRLVNGAIDTHFKFSIDNHTMTVIANDLVPIVPYETTVLNIAIGQRYDIIVTADQADVADDFWIRAIPQSACSDVEASDNIRAIIHYSDSTSTPSTSAWEQGDDSCDDEDASNLVPYLSKTVSDSSFELLSTASVGRNSDNLFRWYLNSSSMEVAWDSPTLLQLSDNSSVSFETDDNLIEIDASDSDDWVYFVIETSFGVPHPIHLHGFDFYVLAQGSTTYDSDSVELATDNPPRRDTAMLPASGYLVIGFPADNPGIWLMHCHIGWHTSMGFDLQLLVRRDDLIDLLDDDAVSTLEDTCSAWETYVEEASVEQDDSGV